MNIRTLGNHTYRLFWELPTGPDGKRRRETRTIHGTWQEAQAAWARRKREIDAGQATEPARMTLGELADRWLRDVVAIRTQEAATLDSYDQQVRVHIKPDIGHLRIGKIRPQHLQSYYARLLTEGRKDGKPGGLAPRTIRYIHSLLRDILGQAVRWGMIPVNPADLVDPPADRQKEARFWTPEQASRFLAALEGHRLAALWLLAILTGLREGELIGLRWSDVDLETGTLSVAQALKRVAKKFGAPKSANSRRTMALAHDAIEALRAHRLQQAQARLKLGPEWEDHGLVFTTRQGRPLMESNLLKMQHRLCDQAGVPYIPIHGMRHTHGTALVAAGVDPKTVQARLGHQSASFTMQTYVHPLTAADKDAARRVEQTVLGRKKPSAK